MCILVYRGRLTDHEQHPLFVKAVHIWLDSKTRLKASVDPTTFLPPARYHADLREGQFMPHEGDVSDDGVESPRPTLNHADSDASITDPEDEGVRVRPLSLRLSLLALLSLPVPAPSLPVPAPSLPVPASQSLPAPSLPAFPSRFTTFV